MLSRLALVALFMLTALAPTWGATIWTAPAMTRVQPRDPPTAARGIGISAARNEYEPFQVIVTAADDGLTGVTVGVSDLKGPRGALIPKNAIKLYREHYIQVMRPSYRCDAPPGWWPDALIPLDAPGGKYVGQPFAAPRGQNQPIWGEVLVPKGIPAGDYTGSILVDMGAAGRVSVPLRLHVWDFDLPDRATGKSDFGGLDRAVEYHQQHGSTTDRLTLYERYAAELIRHRVMPAPPGEAQPKINPDGSLDTTQSHPILKHYIDDLGLRSIRVRFRPDVTYLRNLYSYLQQNGWLELHHIYILDEPNDAEAYAKVRELAAVAHQANRGLKVLCTEQTITQDPAWGDLYGAVDIWVPLWALYDEPTAAQRLALGEEIWGYTALCQGEQPSPWWELDFPVLNYRIPMWVNGRYGMTGLLYWTTCYWEQTADPWTDPLTYKPSEQAVFNMEGSLLYPGLAVGIDGPVTSIRLKMIREGMEDYEYLALLAKRGKKDVADAEARKLARSWFDWEKDPTALLAARQRVAEAIEE